MDEAGFIAALRAIASHPAARGLDDDAAVLEIGGEALVLTHDMIAEGTHYLPGMDMADVAWRLVATNISDLAAKGARPIGVLVGAMLGAGDESFIAGLREALAEYDVPLLGGDTIRGMTGAPRTFGLTAIGLASHRPVPSRAGAKPGDSLWITGAVGAAMVGCEALKTGSVDTALTLPYRRPRALLAEGIALAPLVSAMMDVSDGLLLDASRLASASGVTLALESALVPLAAPEHGRHEALRWGDDYALLFTAAPGVIPPVAACRIGTALARADAPLLVDGELVNSDSGLGYSH